jgi:hypothetical protein
MRIIEFSFMPSDWSSIAADLGLDIDYSSMYLIRRNYYVDEDN